MFLLLIALRERRSHPPAGLFAFNGDMIVDEWPADKVERRDVASLVHYAKNTKTISPAQVAAPAANIRE